MKALHRRVVQKLREKVGPQPGRRSGVPPLITDALNGYGWCERVGDQPVVLPGLICQKRAASDFLASCR